MKNSIRLKKHNKQLIEGIKYSQEHHNLTGRIMREIILPACATDENSREAIAQILYRERHNAPELRAWGMDEDIIQRVLRIHFDNERNRVAANINSQPSQPPTP